MRKDAIAVCVADLHLSLLPPACRADKDWLKTQAFYLKQLRVFAEDLPILCAGDIFDRWNPPPELITFALRELPDGMLCVPGQHDLPNHRLDQVYRSGYGVLVEAGKIKNISSSVLVPPSGNLAAYGFGWEEELEPLSDSNTPRNATKAIIHIALIHRYCWTEGKGYPDAPESDLVSAYKKQLKGYDVAVFGDNHKHFIAQAGDCTVFNCGGFIRRKSDEISRKPCVGLICADGTVERRLLDTSIDLFHDAPEKREEVSVDMKAFIDGLEKLGEHGLNFREAVERHLKNDDIAKETKEIILKALETHE